MKLAQGIKFCYNLRGKHESRGNIMAIYGYARVSTKDQSEDWQVNALKDFGVSAEKIFIDRQSGKDFNRPQYKKLLRRLKADSVLVVKSIDRLGRNYAEVLEQWRVITKEKGAAIVILDMPILDTRNRKDFLGTFIADLSLQIMSALAQTRPFIWRITTHAEIFFKSREQKCVDTSSVSLQTLNFLNQAVSQDSYISTLSCHVYIQ